MSEDRIDQQAAIASNLRGLRIQMAEQGKKMDRVIELLDGDNATPGLRTETRLLRSALVRVRLWIAGIVTTLLYALYHLFARSSQQ